LLAHCNCNSLVTYEENYLRSMHPQQQAPHSADEHHRKGIACVDEAANRAARQQSTKRQDRKSRRLTDTQGVTMTRGLQLTCAK
jgi:hypothetical protein